ncbi:MAG TPA: ECF-type sigma factor [Gemmatimonadaceae bacterium]|nr:ECF-type sigma factor [Gemmatimonadaceae bacterium]
MELVTEGSASVALSSDALGTKDLFAVLYGELHKIAEHNLRRGGSELTLGATTLIHETYLSVANGTAAFPDHPRFLGYASRAMRGLVIDYVRRRQAKKRGRELEITLTGQEAHTDESERSMADLERLGDALEELSAVEPALADLVDLHFFCGYTFSEIATMRGVSERTVQRDWRKARLLLFQAVLPAGEAAAATDAAPVASAVA